MRLTLDEVTKISRAIAQEYAGEIEVTNVVSTDGGTDHVELLMTIVGCHREPCTLMVNVTRDDEAMEGELRARIQEALAAHTRTGDRNHGST
jgi:hypothetical protein